MKLPTIMLVSVLAMTVAAGCGSGPAGGPLVASGTVEATDADLGFQVSGRVAVIGPREGDFVQRGQELAWLDRAEFDAARAVAAAQLVAAEARLSELRSGARPQELAQAEAGLRAASQRSEDARRDAARAQRLLDGGAVSQQASDKASTALEVAEAQEEQVHEALDLVRAGPRAETLRAQSATVEQARANVARTEATLANAAIVAPFPGVVTVRHREPGESVAPGMPVLTLLDRDDRWVRIYVREDQIGRVQIGMVAEISSDSYPDDLYEGVVFFIGSEAEFTPSNVQTPEERIKLMYPVKIRITGDPGYRLKPGIPADVTLLEPGG